MPQCTQQHCAGWQGGSTVCAVCCQAERRVRQRQSKAKESIFHIYSANLHPGFSAWDLMWADVHGSFVQRIWGCDWCCGTHALKDPVASN